MKQRDEVELKLKELKPTLSKNFHVKRIGYFGSYSTGEQTEQSDIDILVEFRKPLGWAFFDLRDLLEDELKAKVDLVSIKALKKQLKDTILNQVRYV